MPRLNDTQAQQAVEGGGEFPLLDPGTYLASLNAVTEKQGKQAPYWEWEFLITEDAEGNPIDPPGKVWENTSLAEKAVWRVAKMLEAFEMTPDTDTDEVLGQYCYVNVGQEIAAQGSRAGKPRNIFLSAFPVSTE